MNASLRLGVVRAASLAHRRAGPGRARGCSRVADARAGHRGRSAGAAQPACRSRLRSVTRATVPVYLEGLGNVQAFYTANITARVDGELQRVAFVEGQMVKQGQLLAQIDPRPNQAALDQAVATEAKDAAQLESAMSDLERYAAARAAESHQQADTGSADGAGRAAAGAAQGRPRDHRQCPHAARLHQHRLARSTAAPASARSIPATMCTPPTPPASSWSTQMQPIAIVFTLPEDDLLAVSRALGAGAVRSTALSRDNQTELDHRHLER